MNLVPVGLQLVKPDGKKDPVTENLLPSIAAAMVEIAEPSIGSGASTS